MDSRKVIVKDTLTMGKGVFAIEHIHAGEEIAQFDGPFLEYDYEGWNDELKNHAIQYAPRKWRDSKGIARSINHSCEPNCGIRELFTIVAMRDIERGEEISWDYEMTEDSHYWRMECRCGTSSCRKIIGAFKNMPDKKRQEYKDYISDWLKEKYSIE